MSKGRSKRLRLDSIISIESLRTSESAVQSSSEVERVPTMQRDHHVESAPVEI